MVAADRNGRTSTAGIGDARGGRVALGELVLVAGDVWVRGLGVQPALVLHDVQHPVVRLAPDVALVLSPVCAVGDLLFAEGAARHVVAHAALGDAARWDRAPVRKVERALQAIACCVPVS